MADAADAQYRSRLLSGLVRKREDVALRRAVEEFGGELRFQPIEKLMISEAAWQYAAASRIDPRLVFAHPEILENRPQSSRYYLGIALLSQKQVQQLAASVVGWEDGSRRSKVSPYNALKVARLYNSVISSIIEDSSDWSLENGYRNIIATMGIRLDGMYRNKIGQMAEELIKTRIAEWLGGQGLVRERVDSGRYLLHDDYEMLYGSEPDIRFDRHDKTVATIEIKGGKDPAGALERLGAMRKSFAETPAGCTNILIAGVVTAEMRARLDEIGVVKVFLLGDLSIDGPRWEEFLREMFHHIVRIA